jgi:TLD
MECTSSGRKEDGISLSRTFTVSTISTNSSIGSSCCDQLDLVADIPQAYKETTLSQCKQPTESNNHVSDGISGIRNPLQHVFFVLLQSIDAWRRNAFGHANKIQEMNLWQQIQEEAILAKSSEAINLRRKKLIYLGEMGLTLFYPIDAVFVSWEDEEVHRCKPCDSHFLSTNDAWEEDEEFDTPRIHVVSEDPSDSTEEIPPFLLSMSIMKEMVQTAMPATLWGRSWIRIFSISRDGDSFGTFLHRVQSYVPTLLVIQTTKGEIVGGFADSPWECRPENMKYRSSSNASGDSFVGMTGASFLFSLVPMTSQMGNGKNPRQAPLKQATISDPIMRIYRWQGVNNYNQICRHREGSIGMGGGGGCFGLFLQDEFSKGTSGACDTYGNPGPLTSTTCFDVLNFEVYGFADRVW